MVLGSVTSIKVCTSLGVISEPEPEPDSVVLSSTVPLSFGTGVGRVVGGSSIRFPLQVKVGKTVTDVVDMIR